MAIDQQVMMEMLLQNAHLALRLGAGCLERDEEAGSRWGVPGAGWREVFTEVDRGGQARAVRWPAGGAPAGRRAAAARVAPGEAAAGRTKRARPPETEVPPEERRW
jgi:hypothetical protein